MFAIIETNGKQYKVSSGDKIRVDLFSSDKSGITIDKVLAIVDGANTTVGTPYVKGASVKAEISGDEKDKKVIVYKQRPRKGFRKLRGHRQPLTLLKINEINYGG